MAFFNIDYTILVRLLTPVKLRTAFMLAWLESLLTPVTTLYSKFMTHRTATLYDANHNGQVCKLEAVLNDRFDTDDKRINIDDGPYKDPLYLYRRSENKPVYLARRSELPVSEYDAPAYLNRRAELAGSGYQFIVYYPTGLVFSMVEMRALIEKYRLPSKNNYGILPYTP